MLSRANLSLAYICCTFSRAERSVEMTWRAVSIGEAVRFCPHAASPPFWRGGDRRSSADVEMSPFTVAVGGDVRLGRLRADAEEAIFDIGTNSIATWAAGQLKVS